MSSRSLCPAGLSNQRRLPASCAIHCSNSWTITKRRLKSCQLWKSDCNLLRSRNKTTLAQACSHVLLVPESAVAKAVSESPRGGPPPPCGKRRRARGLQRPAAEDARRCIALTARSSWVQASHFSSPLQGISGVRFTAIAVHCSAVLGVRRVTRSGLMQGDLLRLPAQRIPSKTEAIELLDSVLATCIDFPCVAVRTPRARHMRGQLLVTASGLDVISQ